MEDYIKMDYTLPTAEERITKVNEILANTPQEKRTPLYLKKLSDYIVSAMTPAEKKEGLIITDNRLVTLKKWEVSFEGLVSQMENGEDGIYNIITNDKNMIRFPKRRISEEDRETVPGLKEIGEAIEAAEAAFQKASGKARYYLKKQIIDMRYDQYILRTAYQKPVRLNKFAKSIIKFNLDEHISIAEDGSVVSDGLVSLFNPKHIKALLCNYSDLKMETWDKFESDMKWLLIDLENLVEKTLKDDYPLYYDLLIYKIDGKQNVEIQQLLLEKHGIKHSLEYISALWCNKIPKLLAETASKDWLYWHYTEEVKGKWKRCSRCKEIKPAHNYFFSKNNTSKDHFYSIFKECRSKKK